MEPMEEVPVERSRVHNRTPHQSISTGRMLFLTPNQQHRSTEGKMRKVMLQLGSDAGADNIHIGDFRRRGGGQVSRGMSRILEAIQRCNRRRVEQTQWFDESRKPCAHKHTHTHTHTETVALQTYLAARAATLECSATARRFVRISFDVQEDDS